VTVPVGVPLAEATETLKFTADVASVELGVPVRLIAGVAGWMIRVPAVEPV
jgi:hypothetical protein